MHSRRYNTSSPSLHPRTSSEAFFFSSCLAAPSSPSFVQYVHYPPLHMYKPPQTYLSSFVFRLINLNYPSNALIFLVMSILVTFN